MIATFLAVLMVALAWTVEPALTDTRRPSVIWASVAFYVRTFQVHVAIGLLGGALFLLARRRWRLFATIVLASGSLLSTTLFTPRLASTTAVDADAPSLRIFSMNLLRPNSRMDEVYQQIQAEKPDVICFQEYTSLQQAKLEPGLLPGYPHRIAFPAYDYRGMAVYSRWPLELEYAPSVRTPHERLLVVRVLREGRAFRLVNMHPTSPSWPSRIQANRSQMAWIIQQFGDGGIPTVLAGDFNCTLNSQQVAALRRAGFSAASEQIGKRVWLTWSPRVGFMPVVGIDHVLFTEDFMAESAKVMPPAGSDHRGISVVLRSR